MGNLTTFSYCSIVKKDRKINHDLWAFNLTFIIEMERPESVGNLFSRGSTFLTSGNLIPTKRGFLRKISLCLWIRVPVDRDGTILRWVVWTGDRIFLQRQLLQALQNSLDITLICIHWVCLFCISSWVLNGLHIIHVYRYSNHLADII